MCFERPKEGALTGLNDYEALTADFIEGEVLDDCKN